MSGTLVTRDTPAEHLLQLIANPFQSQIQLDAFWASLATSLGFTVFLGLIFSLLRPRHTLVYAPKIKHADSKHAPPPMGKGPFSWVKPVMKTKEATLVDKIGMDAVLFLRFTRMLRNIFLVLGTVGVVIMIPVNVSLGVKAISGGSSVFAIMTPLYIFGSGLWAQVVVAWAVDIIVAFFLWWNYKKVYKLRRDYFESPEYQRSLHARSVMIRDIPAKLRSDEGILRLTDEVNPTGILPKPTIGRNVKVLPDLIEEHEETVRQLESVLAKYLKNPDRLPVNRPTMRASRGYKGPTSGGKVDSIEYLTDRIRRLEHQINDMRESVDKRDAISYGFATWEQIPQAHAAAFAATKKKPHHTKIVLAPRPNDLIWKNLPLSRSARVRKRWFNSVWITALTIIWTPLNAGIAIFLSNLSNLGSVWPGFQRQLQAHRTWWAIVQGIASPALTSTVYLILPIIFRRLQIRAGDVTKTSRERHVLRNLYNFFTFNNLIVFSLFSAVWQYITVVINDSQNRNVWDAIKDGDFFLITTTALCQISPFWVTWLLQRNLGAAIDLAQLWTLFYVWFAKTFLAPTPRQKIEWTAPPAFDYASYYNYFLFYATVAFSFATLQPIVLVVTALYFTLDSVLKKYLLMYVFITKTESGGQFWRTLFNRLVFAVCLSNVLVGFVVKARGSWTMVYALIPPILLMILFKFYCARRFDPGMHFYHRTGTPDAEQLNPSSNAKLVNRASIKFRHPVLTKPLMTPMVSAKAKHVMAQIYSGRLGSEAGVQDYSDIALEPMNQSGKPQQDAPFELVPEAQQDFEFYKNRSDFREEGGELYGRTDDMVSERSSTPMSLMTGTDTRPTTPFNDLGGDFKQPAPDRRQEYHHHHPQPIAPIARRPVNQEQLHPALRAQLDHQDFAEHEHTMNTDGDLSMRHGAYTDPNDDRTNLLRTVGDIRTPNGEFMSMDRWQAERSGYDSALGTPRHEGGGGGSYDYFRGNR